MVLSYSNWLTFKLLCYKKEQVKKIPNKFNNIPRGSMNFTGFVGVIVRHGRTLEY